MKIGILTLPLTNNYGGILQAYALQNYLKKLGHEVILIDRRFNKNKTSIKASFRSFASQIFYSRFYKEKENSEREIKEFISNYISKTVPIYSEKDFPKIIEENNIDTIIVGSDQVWRIEYSHNIYRDLFLGAKGIEKLKKLSYAASFGVEKWQHPELAEEIKNFLNSFEAVSVREESGISICENVFGSKAIQHVDPTLLLSENDYFSLIQKESEQSTNPELVTYILDTSVEKNMIVQRISDIIGLRITPITAKNIDRTNFKVLKNYKKISVTKYLRAFYDARFVVTDSFHGTIFSIIFQKPFIVIGNKERGLARFKSLLYKFNLEERIIFSNDDLTEEKVKKDINFEEIAKAITQERNRSFEYFDKHLKTWE